MWKLSQFATFPPSLECSFHDPANNYFLSHFFPLSATLNERRIKGGKTSFSFSTQTFRFVTKKEKSIRVSDNFTSFLLSAPYAKKEKLLLICD